MNLFFRVFIFLLTTVFTSSGTTAQEFSPYSYDVGSPSVTDYYIDPISGSDSNTGRSASAAWKTVSHAWGQVPQSATLSTGYRFYLYNGSYASDDLPNYWELRTGTATHPIIFQAASGQTSVRFTRDINMAHVSYFYLIGVDITPTGGGDALHFENSDHVLVRGCTLNGGSTSGGAHETLKVNQSQYVYIENNNISNADDNNIDFVAVQYGHIIGNRVHSALDWCGYVKGGSAYLRIEGNEFFDCGTGGITAGQGSGFQFMTSPWIHYEAYDIKIVNNVVHDTEGAAFGVNGGYNILVAHNTAYKVGTRDHLVEVVFGERTCDGETEGAAESTCASYNASGGWGASTVHLTAEPIGNKNVSILNNVIYNPSGTTSAQHFAIYGPRTPSGGLNLSSPQVADTNLVIKGNVIWNAPGSAILGVEDSEQGCQGSNPTCNASQLVADNSINTIEPQLADPNADDLRPASGSNLLSQTGTALTSFAGGDRVATPLAPEGNVSNAFTRDLSGASYDSGRIVGAYGSASATRTPPAVGDSPVPEDPSTTVAPTVSSATAKAKRSGRYNQITVTSSVTGSGTVRVKSTVLKGSKTLGSASLRLRSGVYKGTVKIKASKGARLTVRVRATNAYGAGTRTTTVRAK